MPWRADWLPPAERHPQLLAGRREPVGDTARRYRPVGGISQAVAPTGAHAPAGQPAAAATAAGPAAVSWPTRKIDGQIRSGTQQQWLTAELQLGSWTGSNWNMVFVGSAGRAGQHFPNPPYTTVAPDAGRPEKPLPLRRRRRRLPGVRARPCGPTPPATTWANGNRRRPGRSPIGQFHRRQSRATPPPSMNTALAAGQEPRWSLSASTSSARPCAVTRAGHRGPRARPRHVRPGQDGISAMTVADVDGVKIAGRAVRRR